MKRVIDENSLEEVAYSIIEKFIQSAEMSNRSFAIAAGFSNPQTFQNMLYRRSRISMTSYIRIAEAMKHIAITISSKKIEGSEEVGYREDLMYLMTAFSALTPNIDPDKLQTIKKQLRCYPVPVEKRFSDEIWEMSGKDSDPEENEEPENLPRMKMSEDELTEELTNSFYLLNQKGQEKVVEYAEDLAENPRYQKKDGE